MLRPWKPYSHNHEPMLKLYQLHSGSCTSKALCHAKHGCRDSSQELVPPSWLCQGSTIQALRSLRSKQYAANVIDYDHAQNKLQIKAMLNLSPMLVSVEHQYMLMSSSAGNAGKSQALLTSRRKQRLGPAKRFWICTCHGALQGSKGSVQGDLFSEEMSKMVWKNYENEKNNLKQGNLIER